MKDGDNESLDNASLEQGADNAYSAENPRH